MTDSLLKYEYSKDKSAIIFNTGEEIKSFDTLHVSKFSATTILESLVSDNPDLYTKRELNILYADLDNLKNSNEFKDITIQLKKNEINGKNKVELSYEFCDDKTVIEFKTGVGTSKTFETLELLKIPALEILSDLTFDDNEKWKQYEFNQKEKDYIYSELELFLDSNELKDVINEVKLNNLSKNMSELINSSLSDGLDINDIRDTFTKTLLREQDKMIENNKFFKNDKGFEMDTPW